MTEECDKAVFPQSPEPSSLPEQDYGEEQTCSLDPSGEDASENEQSSNDNQENNENEFSRLRVLVIEDDDETVDLFVTCLGELGVRSILVANNAVTAYQQIDEDREFLPDVIILEIDLVGTGGIEFISKLRGHDEERIRTIPAIIVSNNADTRTYRRATRQGISGFIRKPFSFGAILKALVDAMNGHILDTPEKLAGSWIEEAEELERRAQEKLAAQRAKQPPWYVRVWRALWDV